MKKAISALAMRLYRRYYWNPLHLRSRLVRLDYLGGLRTGNQPLPVAIPQRLHIRRMPGVVVPLRGELLATLSPSMTIPKV